MINIFCLDNRIDEREFLKFFWNNSKYPKKKIRIGKKTDYGVNIPVKNKIKVESPGIEEIEIKLDGEDIDLG